MSSQLLLQLSPHTDAELSAVHLPRLGCKLSTTSPITLDGAVKLVSTVGLLATGWGGLARGQLDVPSWSGSPLSGILREVEYAFAGELSLVSEAPFTRGLFMDLVAMDVPIAGFTFNSVNASISFAPSSGTMNAIHDGLAALARSCVRHALNSGRAFAISAIVTLPLGIGSTRFEGTLGREPTVLKHEMPALLTSV